MWRWVGFWGQQINFGRRELLPPGAKIVRKEHMVGFGKGAGEAVAAGDPPRQLSGKSLSYYLGCNLAVPLFPIQIKQTCG